MKRNRTPNPKYAITGRPEVPLAAINSIDSTGKAHIHLGRQYHVAASGVESVRPYLENKGVRRYISEKVLFNTLNTLWDKINISSNLQ